MTVYVDDMYLYQLGSYGHIQVSRMFATTEEELHEMARRLGVQRRRYQDGYYNIALGRRWAAIRYGAVEVTMQTMSAMACLRENGRPVEPHETAFQRFCDLTADWRADIAAEQQRRLTNAQYRRN